MEKHLMKGAEAIAEAAVLAGCRQFFRRDARSLRRYRRTARRAAFCPAPQPRAHSAQGCRHGGQRRVELDQTARRAFPRARGNENCSGQRCKKSLAASQIILATAPCRRYYEQDLISTDADCQIVNSVRINRKTIRFGGRASSLIVMTLGIYKENSQVYSFAVSSI